MAATTTRDRPATGNPPWHTLGHEAVVGHLGSDAAAGLTGAEARERLAQHDPFNARVVVRLCRLLEKRGDLAGALRNARAYEERLRDDLGVEPPLEVVELLARERVGRHDADRVAPRRANERRGIVRRTTCYTRGQHVATGFTLDAHLMALFQAGMIRYEDLITKAQDPETIVQKLEEEGHRNKR